MSLWRLDPHLLEPEPEQTAWSYWRFYDAVTERQVLDWLPAEPTRLLDLSAAAGRYARYAADRGHAVVHVAEDLALAAAAAGNGVTCVSAVSQDLSWLAGATFDAVLAEAGALSAHVAAEHTFDELSRVLRPGGRLLLCVDSLTLGLSRLAEQGRWAELADAPSADVVLVPNEDGSITRCFWPEELSDALDDRGFDVEWIRPRTVLPVDTVERALRSDPRSLTTLVETELALAREREGDANGVHLVAAARLR